MKKLLLTALAFTALIAGPATAADVAAPVYKAPPPLAPIYSWTGFYVDVGWGYGTWAADTTICSFPACLPLFPTAQTQGGRGWFGTVSAGFDYQFSDRIVAGVLADYDFASIKGTIQDPGPTTGGTETMRAAWAVGARIGWLVTPSVLTYVNGGWTGSRWSGSNLSLTFVGFGGQPASTTPGFTTNGWFIGGGIEVMFAPGWFWKNEYRYADYNTTNLPQVCAFAGSCGALPVGATLDIITFRPRVQTARTELVYKFNWGGPVYAKY
jgi:outer membrane immunogenic protein